MNAPTNNPQTQTATYNPAPPTPPPPIPLNPLHRTPPQKAPHTLPPPSPLTPPTTHHQPPYPLPNVDAVLPRGTLVRIIGNNRTKWELHGLQGYVISAQTLGGWHEVELIHGDRIKKKGRKRGDGGLVKVQRNGLEVLKIGEGGVCVVESGIGVAGGRVGKVKSGGKKRRVARIEKLERGSLDRYRRFYGLTFGGGEPSREELVWAVKKHFARQKVDEVKVIDGFLKRIYKGVPVGRLE